MASTGGESGKLAERQRMKENPPTMGISGVAGMARLRADASDFDVCVPLRHGGYLFGHNIALIWPFVAWLAMRSMASPCDEWSGRWDLNPRQPAPKAGALPGCATPRMLRRIRSIRCDGAIWPPSWQSTPGRARLRYAPFSCLFQSAFPQRLGKPRGTSQGQLTIDYSPYLYDVARVR